MKRIGIVLLILTVFLLAASATIGVRSEAEPEQRANSSFASPAAARLSAAIAPQDVSRGWVQMGQGEVVIPGFKDEIGETVHNQSGRVELTAWAHDDDQGQDILWVGSSHGGLWKSIVRSDGNVNRYIPLTENFPGSHVMGSFLVHPHDSHRILVGTGHYGWGSGDGLYKTEDGGTTWSDNLLPSTPKRVVRLIDDRADETGDTVLACTSNGIYRTSHFGRPSTSGTGWSHILTKEKCSDLVQDPNHANKWYAGIEDKGVYYSADGGDSWRPLGVGVGGDIYRVSLAAATSDDRYLYAISVDSNGALNGVYRFDALRLVNPLVNINLFPCIKIFGPDTALGPDDPPVNPLNQGTHTSAIVCDPNDADHVLFGLQELAETSNATDRKSKVDWRVRDGGHHDYNHLAFLPGQTVLAISNDGGFYLKHYGSSSDHTQALDDSGNLLGINSFEPDSTKVQGCLSSAYSNPDIFLAGLQDNGVARGDDLDGGHLTWLKGGDGAQTSIAPLLATIFAASDTFGKRNLSFDAGFTWQSITCSLQPDKSSSVLIDPEPGIASPLIFTYDTKSGASKNSVYFNKVLDFTCPWKQVGLQKVKGAITHIDHTTGEFFVTIPVTVQGDYHLFAYFGPGRLPELMSLLDLTPHQFLCDDPSIPCLTKPTLPDTRVNADRSSLQPGTLYYTTGTGRPSRAFVSFDSGRDWINVTGNIKAQSANADLIKLIANPRFQNEMFMATSRGVFRGIYDTSTGITSWESFSHGLREHEEVRDIIINENGLPEPVLFVATQGRGFWRRKLSATTVTGEE